MSESAQSRQRRDQRAADELPPDHGLMCQAQGCPNRWSVDAGSGRLCSAHAWVGRHLWPQITQEQQDAETERVYQAQFPRRAPSPEVTISAKAEAIARLQGLVAAMRGNQRDGRQWARRLRYCELKRDGVLPNGQRMTQYQRDAWRSVLGTGAAQPVQDVPAQGDAA